jgi:hypothetical protein
VEPRIVLSPRLGEGAEGRGTPEAHPAQARLKVREAHREGLVIGLADHRRGRRLEVMRQRERAVVRPLSRLRDSPVQEHYPGPAGAFTQPERIS